MLVARIALARVGPVTDAKSLEPTCSLLACRCGGVRVVPAHPHGAPREVPLVRSPNSTSLQRLVRGEGYGFTGPRPSGAMTYYMVIWNADGPPGAKAGRTGNADNRWLSDERPWQRNLRSLRERSSLAGLSERDLEQARRIFGVMPMGYTLAGEPAFGSPYAFQVHRSRPEDSELFPVQDVPRSSDLRAHRRARGAVSGRDRKGRYRLARLQL